MNEPTEEQKDLARGYGAWPNEDTMKAGQHFVDLLDKYPNLAGEGLSYRDSVDKLATILPLSCNGGIRSSRPSFNEPKTFPFDPKKVIWRSVAEDLVSRRNIRHVVLTTLAEIFSMAPVRIHEKRGSKKVDIALVPQEFGFSVCGKIGDDNCCLICAEKLGDVFEGSSIFKVPKDVLSPAPAIAFRLCGECQSFTGKLAPTA